MKKPLPDLPDLLGRLRVGRDQLDSEEIGTCRLVDHAGQVEITLTLDLRQFERAAWTTGLLRESVLEDVEAVRERIQALVQYLPEWERIWITSTFAVQPEVEGLSDGPFLRWLEEESPLLHRWLGVPAVQERIAKIRRDGPARVRQRLGAIIARRNDGRPQRLPDEWKVAAWVRNAEVVTRPLHAWIVQSKNPRAAWLTLQGDSPEVAQILEQLGLDQRWFLDANRPREQKRTPYLMACELVAAQRGFSADTIRKAAGAVKARRDRQARRKKPT